MILQWFLSKTVRQATAMRKHVQKLLNHQRDILSPQAIEGVRTAMANCQKAVAEGADKAALEKQMENLEKAANKWLKPYPSAAWRENVEVLLVALAVAMGIRTFFLQPFKIPPGSMQPTLYGVTSDNLINQPDFKIPTGLTRVRQWFEGISYIHLVAENDDDHVIAIFRRHGRWGAIAKSNTTVLRFREPVYRTLRELALSYFDMYFNTRGEKTLRSFSRPVDLSRFDSRGWMESKEDVDYISDYLYQIPHQQILSPAMRRTLEKADPALQRAGFMGANTSGLYKPGKKRPYEKK